MAKKPRVTTAISVPADLKKRMGKVKDVNWSAVACEAFEKRLGEIAQRKEKKSMDDVIQRLRASKKENDSQFYLDGRKFGSDWATNRAEAVELERLEKADDALSDSARYSWGEFLALTYGDAFGMDDNLYFAMHPENAKIRSESKAFWENEAEDYPDRNNADFLQGFTQGALSVWREVKDKL